MLDYDALHYVAMDVRDGRIATRDELIATLAEIAESSGVTRDHVECSYLDVEREYAVRFTLDTAPNLC